MLLITIMNCIEYGKEKPLWLTMCFLNPMYMDSPQAVRKVITVHMWVTEAFKE